MYDAFEKINRNEIEIQRNDVVFFYQKCKQIVEKKV